MQFTENARTLRTETFDLRRRDARENAERLVQLAEWALPEDRAAIHAVYREGLSARELAELRSECPRALRRHLRRLVERLTSDRFLFVLRNRADWPPTRRRVATAVVLQGRTMRDTARHLRTTLHAVRRHMEVVNALAEAAR